MAGGTKATPWGRRNRARGMVLPAGTVRRELKRLGHRPRKRLGQHFLTDPAVAERIVALAQLHGTERVVEIGPGLGALSDILAQRADALWLIEVDAELASHLHSRYAAQRHVRVIAADALAVDFATLLGDGTPAVVVANLPYNIATAVLAALLAQRQCFGRMVLMLQREVVERLRAQPGTKDYSALSVLIQFEAQLQSGLRVGPEAFTPRPKVDSEVVTLEPFREPPVPVMNTQLFIRLVRTVFNQRRKQLANSLRQLCADPAVPLQAAHIDPRRRPETLTLAEFAALSNALSTGRGDE